MRKLTIAAITAALGLATVPARAADNGIYLGGSIGQSNVSYDESVLGEDFSFDVDSTGYKAIAGWRFLDALAVELNYVDLGSGDDQVAGQKIEADVDGISLSGVGFLPVGPVDLFARVGAINWDASISSPGLGSVSDDGTDLTYGAGVQFRVWSLSLRVEYERFDISDADDVDMISAGVTWTFL